MTKATTVKRATMAEAVKAILGAYDRIGPAAITERNMRVLAEAYRRNPARGNALGFPAIFETLPTELLDAGFGWAK